MTNGIQVTMEVGEPRPVRFAVEVDGIQYRLFSYFTVGNDLSVAMQSYFKTTHIAQRGFSRSQEERGEEGVRISQMQKEAQYFTVNKHTFHRSGVQNIKNRQGSRPSDRRDRRSISFDDIADAIRLFYIYPTTYSRYPRIVVDNKKHHNVLCLKGDIRSVPIMIDVRLSRIGFPMIDRLTSAYSKGFAAFIDGKTLVEVDLNIVTVFRKSPNSFWPKAEAIVAEYY